MNKNKWVFLSQDMFKQQFLTVDNPVVVSLTTGAISAEQGMEVLRQYYYLVVTIVQFLAIAMARIPVEVAKKELLRNLGEELGSRTSGVSHQELFASLVKKELGIEIRTIWNGTTANFIGDMLTAFNTCSQYQVAGMVYALEATASPELVVVAQIINLSAERQVVNLSKLTGPAHNETDYKVETLEQFIASHTRQFELGHESGLRETLEEFASEDWEKFEDGFNFVLASMQLWWTNLARPDQP